ncbi:MAG: hypothetical protein JHD16_03570 [Solirubrobacteraceae bacterium]|nr:hypothetical protein [Solirubrobacteraceae bacterium]
MSGLWIQHGYGKGTKISDIRDSALAAGVVLSPGDEGRRSLSETRSVLGRLDALLDPQTFVYSIPGGTARCHEDNGLAFSDLHWSASPAEVVNVAEKVVATNRELDIPRVVAPTCLQRDFRDVWTPLSLQLARATLAAADRPVLASLVIDEGALSNWHDATDWLDVATTLDVAGFYIVVNRGSSSYQAPWDPARLVTLLRLIYSLTELNGYEVILGYSDFEGLLGAAFGASGHGTGWYYSLRRFSETKWQPSTGGRAASPRVTSGPLMAALRADGEADLIVRTPLAASVFPSQPVRTRLAENPTGWSLPDSWDQHMREMGSLSRHLMSERSTATRLDTMQSLIDGALRLSAGLEPEGVLLPAAYTTRLQGFSEAVAVARELERV